VGIDHDPRLKALGDPELLTLATEEGRILVTANARDFDILARD
jgi:hypothetical protein